MKSSTDLNVHPRHCRLKGAFTSIAQLANKAQTHMAACLRIKPRSIAISLAPFLLAIPMVHAQPAADWMSGEMGVGWRFRADDKTQIANWDVATLVNQVKSIPNVNHVVFNLSDAAHGDAYIAPHSVLTAITPSATPDNDRDLFMEMATAFQAEGFKVIAYIATQGPAMLKHGAQPAFDSVEVSPGVYTSQAMDNWEAYVYSVYNIADFADEREMYKRAFAEVILDEYAARYGTLIDGWWFDNGSSNYDAALVHSIAKQYNPNSVVTTSHSTSVYSDYLNGHPTPVAQYPASDLINLPRLTAIEASPDGYFYKGTQPNLGHMFMPLGTSWNGGAIVWPLDQAADWMTRCLNAGGSWTWNVDLTDLSSIIRADSATFLTDLDTEVNSMVASNLAAPVFSQASYDGGNAQFGVAYTGSLAGSATDADGDALTYAIAPGGPDWLEISSAGALSGTPYNTWDLGMNRFTLVVADGKGLVDFAELEIYVTDESGSDISYVDVSFDNLRGNLSSGSINTMSNSDPDVTITKATDGNDVVLSLSISNQSFDGGDDFDNSLSWDVRVKGYSAGTYTVNGNDSSVSLGASAPVGTINNEFGVSGNDTRYLNPGESVQFSIENIVLTADDEQINGNAGFHAVYDGAWITVGTYILGTGGSGLESMTIAANADVSLTPTAELTLTSTSTSERIRDVDGMITIYPNNAPFFLARSIQVNAEDGVAYSDTLTNLAATATDLEGDPLTYSKAAGPAWLSVASDGTLSGTPGAADVGLNTFTIQVEDQWATSDTLIVEVSVSESPPTPLENWRFANFGSSDNTGIGADTANPDSDSLVNLLEFAFGTDPNVSDAGALTVNEASGTFTPGTPVVGITFSPLSVKARFIRRTDHASSGITYTAQFSYDLGVWEDLDGSTAVQIIGVSESVGYEAVEMDYPTSLSGGKTARFYRMNINETVSGNTQP